MAERKKGQHLRWEDCLKIEGALRARGKLAEIAKMIGFCRATIYNEINRGQCTQQHDAEFVEEYCADVAERKYQENLRAKGPELKLGSDFAPGQVHREQDHNRPLLPRSDPGLHPGAEPTASWNIYVRICRPA